MADSPVSIDLDKTEFALIVGEDAGEYLGPRTWSAAPN
jgi:hypothetical protein